MLSQFFRKNKLGLVVAGIFFVIALATINDYGFTWDTPNHFISGKKFVDLFAGRAVDLSDVAPYSPALQTFSYLVSQALASLGLLPVDAGFHLSIIVIASLGLFLFFVLLKQVLGEKVALVSTLFLATYPRFVGHAHQNFKDIPSATMFMLTVVTAYFAFQRRTRSWILATGVVFGLALATKINAVFIPIVLVIWRLVEVAKSRKKKSLANEFSLWLKFLPAGLVAAVVWFMLSPLYWQNPIGQVGETLEFFRTTWYEGRVLFWGKIYFAGVNVPPQYATTYLALVTPLTMLAAALVGIFVALKKFRQSPIFSLLLVWLVFPLAKYLYSGFILYDDIRQFIEVVFPLSALAGIGLVGAVSWLAARIRTVKADYLLFLLTLLALTPALVALARYHPYQIIYFNGLTGGASGAQGQFDIDFWLSSLKEGAIWLNQNAKPGAVVTAPLGNNILPFYLRDDIEIATHDLETPDYVFIINRESQLPFTGYIGYTETGKRPVYVIKRDGADLGWIYKN